MKAPEISIIVVSYNTQEMTLACIASVYEQTRQAEFELIVYDNDSKDGSAESIKEQFPEVKLIAAKDNIGFAMGNNEAIKQATGDYILLLNPDTVVLDAAIDQLLEFAKEYDYAEIWGGRTLFGDKTLNVNSCFRKMSVWNQFCRASGLAAIFRSSGFFNSEEYGGWKRDTIRQVDIVCGCFFLIKRHMWNTLQGFDKRFFMYAEEADLCLRAHKLGAKPMITPNATIIHYGGGSEKIRSDKMVRLLSAKSELLSIHWPNWKIPFGKIMLKSWVGARVVALAILSFFSPEKYRANLQNWKDIWARSDEWINGYTGRKAK